MNYDPHFRDRLKQRFGLGGKKVIGQILSRVNPGNFVENSSNGNSIHRVQWEDRLMYLVRSKSHGGFVTVMTHNQFVLKEIE